MLCSVSLIQVSTAGVEPQRRKAMRCIDMPLKYHGTALIFVARDLPHGAEGATNAVGQAWPLAESARGPPAHHAVWNAYPLAAL